MRELAEESGLTAARLVRKLGEAWRTAPVGQVPAGLEEQVHHAYHLHLDEPTKEARWEWDECSDGNTPRHRFAFRWVDLESAASVLFPIQAMWIAPAAVLARSPLSRPGRWRSAARRHTLKLVCVE